VSAPRIVLAAVALVIACNDAGSAGASASDSTGATTSSSTDATTSTTGAATSTSAADPTTTDADTTTSGEPTTSTTSSTTGEDSEGDLLTRCPQVAPPAQRALVTDIELTETSGLIESRTHPGVFWLHNDSGDTPRFFAIDAAGARLGAFDLAAVAAVDWEDMSSGPGPTPGEWLYFGDIGDNDEKREFVTVYRVPEPDLAALTGETAVLSGAEAIRLVYPDKPHNAETLLVDPQTGDLVIVAKGEPTRIFRLPGPVAAGGPHTLEEIAPIQFPAPVATGGDISPRGDFIAVRTYTHAFLWLRPPGASIADAFAGEPCTIPLAVEIQGETLAIAHDSAGYYTLSEGVNSPLWWYAFE
jgi:hypothetical protein